MERKQKRWLLRGLGIAAALLCASVAVYSAGRTYFSEHFLPGTSAMAVDASYMTADELARTLEEFVDDYAVHVSNEQFELDVASADVDGTCDARDAVEQAMASQDVNLWPLHVFDHVTVAVSLDFDQEALHELVDKAVASYNRTAKEPVSATLKINKEHTSFYIARDKDGTALDPDCIENKVAKAMERGEKYVALGREDLVQPAYRKESTQAQEAVDRANKVFDLTIDLVRKNKKKAYALESDELTRWLATGKDLAPGFDEKSFAAWAADELWPSVNYSDDDGVYLLDATKLAARVAERISAVSSKPVEVPYTVIPRYLSLGGVAGTSWNEQDGRYIEVDKARQLAVLYDEEGRVLWETPVTTGNESTGDGTPTGVFSIYDKKSDFVLIGQDRDGDGKPDYEHPVEYWMPFNGSIGFHDASWREEYGGTEYQEHGSGGCVNLPHDAALALYQMTHVGEVVVVHE